jgi:hypothetical protein
MNGSTSWWKGVVEPTPKSILTSGWLRQNVRGAVMLGGKHKCCVSKVHRHISVASHPFDGHMQAFDRKTIPNLRLPNPKGY